MFSRIAPQQARDDSGTLVRIVDRQHVEWVNGSKRASVEVDFGSDVGVFCSTLSWLNSDGAILMSETERILVLTQIVEGLQSMGLKVERCE
jgi:hypothetical protein